MHTFVIYIYYLLMRKVFTREWWLDVTFVGTIDFLCHWIMRKLVYIRMAVSAGDISVDSISIYILTDKVTPFMSLFINSPYLTILMTHQTIFFVCCINAGSHKREQKEYCKE
ncbi:MAG: hypothetical protein C4581_01980 [Nitrospiraceae bacterium]|nr:MAG: hypothetical protein C4581_01980 [Nitrospiraceae bacterium]